MTISLGYFASATLTAFWFTNLVANQWQPVYSAVVRCPKSRVFIACA